MQLQFTYDEKIDFLLLRGYILYQIRQEYEVNVYQNVFVDAIKCVELVIKEKKFYSIEAAFNYEMKQEIIYRLWQ